MTNFNELTIETITNEQVEELANEIFKADNGYDSYPVEELNTILYGLGIADEEGIFLVEVSERVDEVQEIMESILY